MQSKAKGKGNLSVLMDYAGRRRVLTYLSWVLSAVSALTALVPFIFVWLIVREVIEANGNFAAVQGSLSVYGWWAVGSALISMLVYFAALMCSHVAAFRVAGNMRKRAMRHIGALPVGFMNSLGSGRVRRIVNESGNGNISCAPTSRHGGRVRNARRDDRATLRVRLAAWTFEPYSDRPRFYHYVQNDG